MADKNPFGSLGLGQMGGERSFMYKGGPLSNALSGLKDMAIIRGVEASGLQNFLNNMGVSRDDKTGAYTYKSPNAAPANAVPPPAAAPAAGAAPVPPVAPAAPSVTPAPAQQTAPDADAQADTVWGGGFTPRNTQQDQLPQQFAMGVPPPMMDIPQAQIPQSSGIGKMLMNMAFA